MKNHLVLITEENELGQTRSGYKEFEDFEQWGNDNLIGRAIKARNKSISCIHDRSSSYIFSTLASDRLINNLRSYLKYIYDKKNSNCSTFARMLRFGDYVDCRQYPNLQCFNTEMRNYGLEAHASVGDVVCIIYSKRNAIDNSHDSFFNARIDSKIRTYSPQEVTELVTSSASTGYHFQICTGYFKGYPVWLSQCGRQLTEHDESLPVFTLTLGEENPYKELFPTDVLIT